MKQLLFILTLMVLVSGCKKDKIPAGEPSPTLTKWERISGHYNVYDTLGNFLYEMDISHSIGTSIYGYRVDSLHYSNFDGNFTLHAVQSQSSSNPNGVTIGCYSAIPDSIDNHWDLFDYGSSEEYNTFRDDTIVFYFEKQNMPYWWNDATAYYHANEKHVAVKQH
jgi:hypothetical protein